VLAVLRVRGIAVPDAARERIPVQKDPSLLECWLEKTALAASLAEVIDDPSGGPLAEDRPPNKAMEPTKGRGTLRRISRGLGAALGGSSPKSFGGREDGRACAMRTQPYDATSTDSKVRRSRVLSPPPRLLVPEHPCQDVPRYRGGRVIPGHGQETGEELRDDAWFREGAFPVAVPGPRRPSPWATRRGPPEKRTGMIGARAWTAMPMMTELIFCTGAPQARERVPSTWTRRDCRSAAIWPAMRWRMPGSLSSGRLVSTVEGWHTSSSRRTENPMKRRTLHQRDALGKDVAPRSRA
jgi:hypothetical protein